MSIRERYRGDLVGFSRALGLKPNRVQVDLMNRVMAGESRVGTTWRTLDTKRAVQLQGAVTAWRLLIHNDGSSLIVCRTNTAALRWFAVLRDLWTQAHTDIQRAMFVHGDAAFTRGKLGHQPQDPFVRWIRPGVANRFTSLAHRHLMFVVPNLELLPTEPLSSILTALTDSRLFMGHMPRSHAKKK